MSISHEAAVKEVLSDGTPVHVFRPDTPTTRAVVLLHERYGLVQHTLDLGAKFASEGLVALTPDLFEGHVDDYDAIRRGDKRAPLFDDDVVRVTNLCLDVLREQHGIEPGSVAVMGVCQSGRHPICVGHANPSIGAAALFYGGAQPRDWEVNEEQPIALEEMLTNFQVPLFATFGEGDHIISVDDVLRFRGALEAGRRSYTIRIQANGPHGFMDSTKPGRYRPAETAESWAALMAFLNRHLGKERDTSRVVWEFHSNISTDYDYSKNVRLE